MGAAYTQGCSSAGNGSIGPRTRPQSVRMQSMTASSSSGSGQQRAPGAGSGRCPAVGIEAAGQRADLPGQRPDLFPLRLAVQQGSLCRGRGLRGQKHTEVLQSLADAVHRDQVSLGWTEQVRERVGERLRRTERTRAVRQEVRGAAGRKWDCRAGCRRRTLASLRWTLSSSGADRSLSGHKPAETSAQRRIVCL